jgi:hypothetical protein
MTAYWINTFIDISDEVKLARYVELAGPAMRAAGGRFLARGEPAHVSRAGQLCARRLSSSTPSTPPSRRTTVPPTKRRFAHSATAPAGIYA